MVPAFVAPIHCCTTSVSGTPCQVNASERKAPAFDLGATAQRGLVASVLAFAAARGLRRSRSQSIVGANRQRESRTVRYAETEWTSAQSPVFETFSCKLAGRWQGWQTPWLTGCAEEEDAVVAFDEVSADVVEIFRRCGSVNGIDDFGRRDLANPGFVNFECGSWMEGPCEGVRRGGSFTVSLTVGSDAQRRYMFTVETSRARIGRARASILYKANIPAAAEVREMPRGSLLQASDWTGSAVQAIASGSQWSSRRLSWQRSQSVAVNVADLDEIPLPVGCFAATRKLPGGGVDFLVGVLEQQGARVMTWRHDASGQPTGLSLSTVAPEA